MMNKPVRQRSSSAEYRETLHELNQRYKHAWDRAERLQDELDDIKQSRAYQLLCGWRWLMSFRRAVPVQAIHPTPALPIELLEDQPGTATGTVTIVIPFRDRLDLLRNCLRSLRRGTYRHFDLLLLDNGSTCARTLRYLERGQARSRFEVLSCPGPFNFAKLCNLGARHASGDFLCFLNNDIEVLSPDWLEQLLRLGNRADVGAVGATLLYPDGTLQHAGIVPGEGGQWSHAYRGFPQDRAGEHGELRHARCVPAVTGACLLMRRHLFHAMGGFDERFAVTHNDVDLCCRLRARGLKIAITPHARLWHFECLTRGYTREPLQPILT